MAKFVHDDVMDALLKYMADNGDKLFVCSAQPTTYTEASATYMLAQHNMTVGHGNGDYTVENAAPSGRKLTVTEQSGISITNTGTANCVAICDSANAKVLWVTTLAANQSLTSGNTVTVPTFSDAIADPV